MTTLHTWGRPSSSLPRQVSLIIDLGCNAYRRNTRGGRDISYIRGKVPMRMMTTLSVWLLQTVIQSVSVPRGTSNAKCDRARELMLYGTLSCPDRSFSCCPVLARLPVNLYVRMDPIVGTAIELADENILASLAVRI